MKYTFSNNTLFSNFDACPMTEAFPKEWAVPLGLQRPYVMRGCSGSLWLAWTLCRQWIDLIHLGKCIFSTTLARD
jgi:hypothetical protein